MPSVWEVVGGAAKGGLVVREAKEASSSELPGRLSTGALVVALEHDAEAERMFYEKVSGEGPESGWVSTMFRGKELLVLLDEELSTNAETTSNEGAPSDEEVSSADPAERAELAMQLYSLRFGEAEVEGDDVAAATEKVAAPSLPVERDEAAEQAIRAEFDAASDCQDGLESMARAALKELKEKEHERKQKIAQEKHQAREDFDIGWKAAEHIPRNDAVAERLACELPQGMCCLVFNEESNSVSVAATVEPSAAINLEYLSTALEVRRRNNREPLFSLDPTDAGSEFFDPKRSMQVKRFEPAWLAGTSVGEVLFQSDYHLKELSMGEYEQPVVGMKSCHEFSNLEGPEWSAREWFVVRKAEVQMSGDNVLMPSIKMGVEAREQIIGENGLEDVRTTKPNHPLVKYAEMFTHNFDLIAERKSVVFHLRELAKASVLAKFLVESGVDLDDSWFKMAADETDACCMEIPQLWNDRSQAQIRVHDGKIVEDRISGHSLYGGVQFGLDKFALSGARQPARMMSAGLAARQFVQPARHLSATLSAGLATRQFQRSFGPMGVQPARVSAGVGLDKFALSGARQPARMMSAGLAARQFVQPARHLSATLSAGLATRQFQRSFGPMGVQPARVAGVDLNLDEFNLSAPTDLERMDICVQLEAGADFSKAFWANLSDETPSQFSEEDKTLLKRVFNPHLSDRVQEGDLFIPPDTSFAYVQRLRSLVKEEEAKQQQRKEHFCSAAFSVDEPGSLFPASWASAVKCEGVEAKKLHARSDYEAQTHVVEGALKSAVPTFDKTAEDGASYRIYTIGSLEVRTIREHDGEEAVKAIFSTRGPAEV